MVVILEQTVQKLRCLLGLLLFFAWSICPHYALGGQITGVRIGQGAGAARLVFDADSRFDYKIFTLAEPNRLVIDTQNIDIASSAVKTLGSNAFIKNIRTGSTGVKGVRVVFDLQRPAIIKKAFMLSPQSTFKWRLVIDLETSGEREFLARVGNSNMFSSQDYNKKNTSSVESSSAASPAANPSRKRIIVIDAGHGGVDPGAIGVSGTYEKNITLSMAKELKELLDKNSKSKVYLTRSRDIFIPLRERVNISRSHRPDLFISVHADSAKNSKATGLSVYTLSEAASDKEAAALAEKENKADIVAGVNFVDYSKDVNDILLNLAQRDTNNSSSEFASILSSEMAKIVKTVSNTHRFAGFAVLKAPDVPSVLLELGYLSNPAEEKRLKQKSYRADLAKAALRAIDKYFQNAKH